MPFSFPSLALRRHVPSLATAVIGVAVYLAWRPPSTDLANQMFRAELFRRAPFAPWNNLWFAGHHTPADYLLAPPLGSVIGAVAVGVVAVLFAALIGSMLIHRLVETEPGLRRPQFAAVLFTIGSLASLYGGRTAFVLGSALGAAALLCAANGRWWLCGLLGALCAFGSPVAALFLSLIGCGILCARALPSRTSLALIVAPVLAVGVLILLFPEGGDFPFPTAGAVNTLAVSVVVIGLGWRYVSLRWVGAGYIALCLLCLILVTPVGGNAARFAALLAPVVAVLVATFRVEVVAALLVPLAVLQWAPMSEAVSPDGPQTEIDFYRPLLEVLATRPLPLRIEVVPVATHSEADVVGRVVPLARGWSRQLDRKYDSLFYQDRLDAGTYLAWLEELGVSVVAIAETKLDVGGRREEELLASPPSYLHEIHRDSVWRVFEVVPQPSLVDGAATMTDMDVDSFTIDASAAGPVIVKVRFSPWFRVVAGAGCVRETSDGWTAIDASAGTLRVEAQLSFDAVFDRDGDC